MSMHSSCLLYIKYSDMLSVLVDGWIESMFRPALRTAKCTASVMITKVYEVIRIQSQPLYYFKLQFEKMSQHTSLTLLWFGKSFKN